MSSQSLVIKKGRLKPTISKDFINQVNLNSALAKLLSSSFSQNLNESVCYADNKMKISLYQFSRALRVSKTEEPLLKSLSWKFRVNGFYDSSTETERRKKSQLLRGKIDAIRNNKIVAASFQKPVIVAEPLRSKQSFSILANGLNKFENFYSDYSTTGFERRAFLKTLKLKRFFPSVFFSRLFLYVAKTREKYPYTFYYIFKRKRKLDSLFHVYTLGSLKFKDVRKHRKKLYKRIIWKVKRQKKWKRRLRVSFALFRLRQRLSQVFYVPKHFEINYKTFTTSYLGYTDSKTTNTKIAFWLNLRKLLTFIS